LKVGILSDTHNSQTNTRIALDRFRDLHITRLIHCGDITTPEMLMLFMGWDVSFVLGNMDMHWNSLADAARRIGVPIPQLTKEVEIDGKKFGVTHGADSSLLYGMMMSGKYDYVCHGHTHRRRNELRSAYGVRLINPGALGGSQPESRSVCVVDTTGAEVEFIEFPELV